MKSKFLFSCLIFSTMLTAQISNLPTVLNLVNLGDKQSYGAYGVVPSVLSYDGTNRVYIRPAENQIAIYTNDFTPVKQFNISPNYEGSQSRPATREVTVTVTYGEVSKNDYYISDHPQEISYYDEAKSDWVSTYEIPESWTNMDIANYLQEMRGTSIARIETNEEGTVFFPDWNLKYADDSYNTYDYYKPETYGKKYPKSGYIVKNGYLYSFTQYYTAQKEVNASYGEWVEDGQYETYEYVQNWGLPFTNYDNDPNAYGEGNGFSLTQTLFNEDAQYEYLYFPISSYARNREYNEPERYEWYEESTTITEEEHLYYRSVYAGFEVKSENGGTIQSISFPNGFIMKGSISAQVIKLSNEYYILCTGEMNNTPTLLVYKINRNGGSHAVQQVGAPMRISAFPSPAARNQNITVQLNGENKSTTELEVINMNGQVMEQRLLSSGEQQATINASHLSPGVNFIRAHQNGKTVGTSRIIVK